MKVLRREALEKVGHARLEHGCRIVEKFLGEDMQWHPKGYNVLRAGQTRGWTTSSSWTWRGIKMRFAPYDTCADWMRGPSTRQDVEEARVHHHSQPAAAGGGELADTVEDYFLGMRKGRGDWR
jgi:hypothetical protein